MIRAFVDENVLIFLADIKGEIANDAKKNVAVEGLSEIYLN